MIPVASDYFRPQNISDFFLTAGQLLFLLPFLVLITALLLFWSLDSAQREEIEALLAGDFYSEPQPSDESVLEVAQFTIPEASQTLDDLNVEIRALDSDQDEIQATKASACDPVRQASIQTSSLKNYLEIIQEENRGEAEHVRAVERMKVELDNTLKLLEDKRIEEISASEIHAVEL